MMVAGLLFGRLFDFGLDSLRGHVALLVGVAPRVHCDAPVFFLCRDSETSQAELLMLEELCEGHVVCFVFDRVLLEI